MLQNKHRIKMIVTDLDETLLGTDKKISDNTKTTLNKCRELGIKVVYATGRGRSAESIAPSGLFDGKITMNGAIAKINDTIVYNRLIPCKTARPLLIACDNYGLKTALEINGMQYSNFNVSDEWPYVTNYEKVDFSKHEADAEKLYMLINSQDDVMFIEKHLSEDIYFVLSKDGLGQVMHKEATKSKAIMALAREWNIDKTEIVAFGDDMNDIDMLKYAGIGVAMENALDEVKAAADLKCLSNNDDGVAEWIKKNILCNPIAVII